MVNISDVHNYRDELANKLKEKRSRKKKNILGKTGKDLAQDFLSKEQKKDIYKISKIIHQQDVKIKNQNKDISEKDKKIVSLEKEKDGFFQEELAERTDVLNEKEMKLNEKEMELDKKKWEKDQRGLLKKDGLDDFFIDALFKKDLKEVFKCLKTGDEKESSAYKDAFYNKLALDISQNDFSYLLNQDFYFSDNGEIMVDSRSGLIGLKAIGDDLYYKFVKALFIERPNLTKGQLFRGMERVDKIIEKSEKFGFTRKFWRPIVLTMLENNSIIAKRLNFVLKLNLTEAIDKNNKSRDQIMGYDEDTSVCEQATELTKEIYEDKKKQAIRFIKEVSDGAFDLKQLDGLNSDQLYLQRKNISNVMNKARELFQKRYPANYPDFFNKSTIFFIKGDTIENMLGDTYFGISKSISEYILLNIMGLGDNVLFKCFSCSECEYNQHKAGKLQSLFDELGIEPVWSTCGTGYGISDNLLSTKIMQIKEKIRKESLEKIKRIGFPSENYKIDKDMSKEEKLENGWKEEFHGAEIYGVEKNITVLKKELDEDGSFVFEYQDDGNIPKHLVGQQLFSYSKSITGIGKSNSGDVSGLISSYNDAEIDFVENNFNSGDDFLCAGRWGFENPDCPKENEEKKFWGVGNFVDCMTSNGHRIVKKIGSDEFYSPWYGEGAYSLRICDKQ